MRLRLPQTVVYWATSAADRYGRPVGALPEQLAARWEDKTVETIDGSGAKVLSGAQVFLACPVAVGGRLRLGTLAEVSESGFVFDTRIAREIIRVESVPSLHGRQSLTTAFLI